jgi:thioredoxin
MTRDYESREPPREEVDRLPGATVIEFGNAWCGYCRAAQPHIEAALAQHPSVRHIKIADASGKRLGRSFGVKLWPTLIFLRDGEEASRLVRPRDAAPIGAALAAIDPSG